MRNTTILLSGALLLATTMAFASGPGYGHGKKHIERMTNKLELSDTQAKQFKDIMNESHKKMQAIRTETKSKVNSVLTAEQQEKMQKIRQQHHEKKRERREEKRERREEK